MLIYNYYIYHSHSQTAIGAMLLPMSLAQEHANNLFESVIDGSLGSYIYNVLFYIAVILRDNAIYLLFIITIIAEWKSFVENRNLRFIVITLILFTAYFTYIINKQDRFIIAFIGLMSILASRTLVKYYDKIKEYYSTEKKKKAKKTNASKNLATYYILSIILVAGVITTFIALNSCISFYSWYSPSNSAPSVVSFYKYFDGKNITGPLLVTNPVITAYSDIRFIPYYDVVSNMAYVNPWEMGDNINGAVYVSGSTPCEENDTACKDKNDRFYNYLRSDFKLVYKTTFDNNDYQIFLNKE